MGRSQNLSFQQQKYQKQKSQAEAKYHKILTKTNKHSGNRLVICGTLKSGGDVAQLDRAPDFGSGGRGFESFRHRHYICL